MTEDKVELLKIITSKGDTSDNGIAHNSNSAKHTSTNDNLTTSVEYTSDSHRNSIVVNAWDEDDAVPAQYQSTLNDTRGAKFQKVLLWRTVHQFLSATSFHGLPFIASSRRFYCGLTYWIIPLVISLALMLWALISVTNQYSSMNTILFSKLHFNNRLPFPAVTICNKNYFRKSVAANTGISLNKLVRFLHVAAGDPFLVKNFDFDLFFNMHRDLIEAENSVFFYNNSGHQLEQMLYSCKFAGEECSLHNFTQRSSFNGNCYTFNSGINTSVLYSIKRGYRYGLEVVLNAEQYEYFLAESVAVGFNVFVHDQDQFPYYERVDSFSVGTGQQMEVALRKVDYNLLTSSYGGQCRDDVNLKYFGRYSYSSCITECLTDSIVRVCKCKEQYLPGPAEVCKLTSKCLYSVTASFNEEQCNCPIPCDFTIYEKMLSYSRFPPSHFIELLINNSDFLSQIKYDFPDFVISTTARDEDGTVVQNLNENFNRTFLTDNFVKLLIYYDTLVSTSMEEGLEYTTAQFIADFSGYVGLFTGAGFLTIFEIIQLCFGLTSPELMPIY